MGQEQTGLSTRKIWEKLSLCMNLIRSMNPNLNNDFLLDFQDIGRGMGSPKYFLVVISVMKGTPLVQLE